MNRRGFLNLLATLVHTAVAACALIPGVAFLTGATRRNLRRDGFVRTIRVADLKASAPTRVEVHTDRWDAYIHYPPGPIGSVWLVPEMTEGEIQTDPETGATHVRCLQTICPHLGCAIDFAPDRDAFVCPCHASEFSRSGKSEFGPAPRPMDELTCRLSEPDADGERWIEVEYREFKTGIARREETA